MGHLITVLAKNAYTIELVLMELTMLCILVITVFGKRKNSWVMPVSVLIWVLVCDVFFMFILGDIYGSKPWFSVALTVCSLAASLTVMITCALAWREPVAKFFLAFILANFIVALLGMGPSAVGLKPPVSFLCSVIVFTVLYILTRPLLVKYRSYRLRHPLLAVWIILVFLINSNFSYLYYRGPESLQDPTEKTFLIGVQFGAVSVIILLILLICFSIKNIRMQKQLLADKNRLEQYYSRVENEISELTVFREQSDARLQEINALMRDSRSDVDALKKYLADLKKRYDSLGRIFYCNDYIVDGVLADFALACQNENIKTDILFQNYDRGIIAAEDLLGVLFILMDSGKDYVKMRREEYGEPEQRYEEIIGSSAKIILHAGVVKNQLILTMSAAAQPPEILAPEKSLENESDSSPENVPEGDPKNCLENVTEAASGKIPDKVPGKYAGQCECRKKCRANCKERRGRQQKKKHLKKLRRAIKKYDGSISSGESGNRWQVIVGMRRE